MGEKELNPSHRPCELLTLFKNLSVGRDKPVLEYHSDENEFSASRPQDGRVGFSIPWRGSLLYADHVRTHLLIRDR